jgi:hypothetical protein
LHRTQSKERNGLLEHLKPEFFLVVICAATPRIGQIVHLSWDSPRPSESVEVEAGAVRAEDGPACPSDIAEGRSKEHDRTFLPCFHAFKADPSAGVRNAAVDIAASKGRLRPSPAAPARTHQPLHAIPPLQHKTSDNERK